MLEGLGMYDGLEALPSDNNTCVFGTCASCASHAATVRQYMAYSYTAAGHVLRVRILNGNIDPDFRDEVLTELYRSVITVDRGDGATAVAVTVGSGLAAAQIQGFRVRDPRTHNVTSSDKYGHRVQELSFVPFRVCPKWLDSADCVLDIPTFAAACTIASASIRLAPIVWLRTTATLAAHVLSGRVQTCFGFDRTFNELPPLSYFSLTSHSWLASFYTRDTSQQTYMAEFCDGRKTVWYIMHPSHIPETLVVHYEGDERGSVDSITLHWGSQEEPHDVVVCPDVRVDATGNSGSVCVFDLHGLFAEPPVKIVLYKVHSSFLCSLLVCAGAAPEAEPDL